MEICRLARSYYVRRLGENDLDLIFKLCSENHMFYQNLPPLAIRESILKDMSVLPPGKGFEDKYYIGFFDGSSLIAIMDLIAGFPSDDIAFIGLFMTDTEYQHRGIGSKIIGEVIESLRDIGYKEIRLGVDKSNPQSYSFWLKNGFKAVKEDKYVLMALKTQTL